MSTRSSQVGLWVAAVLATLGSSCARCAGGTVGAADAGAAVGSSKGLPVAVDLRNAFFTLLPEFRGVRLGETRAIQERVLSWDSSASWVELTLAELRKKSFRPEDGGEHLSATFPPFFFEARGESGRIHQRLWLPLGPEDLPKLLQTPAPLTSEHMGSYMPLPPGAQLEREGFVLDMHYEATPDRAAFLVHQLVGGLLGGEWRAPPYDSDGGRQHPWGTEADGGKPWVGVPEKASVVLRRIHLSTEILVSRDAGRVHLEYRQPILR